MSILEELTAQKNHPPATLVPFEVEKVRGDFPALHQEVNGQPLEHFLH